MNFTLPANAVSDIASSTSEFIGSVAPFVTLVIGIFLAIIVVTFIVGQLYGHKGNWADKYVEDN